MDNYEKESKAIEKIVEKFVVDNKFHGVIISSGYHGVHSHLSVKRKEALYLMSVLIKNISMENNSEEKS